MNGDQPEPQASAELQELQIALSEGNPDRAYLALLKYTRSSIAWTLPKGHKHYADDLSSWVMIRFFKYVQYDNYEVPRPQNADDWLPKMMGYLSRIMRSVVADYLGRQRRGGISELETIHYSSSSAMEEALYAREGLKRPPNFLYARPNEDDTRTAERARYVSAAKRVLDSLDPMDRELVLMRLEYSDPNYEASYKEIAKHFEGKGMNYTPDHLRKRMSRVTKRMEKQIVNLVASENHSEKIC